MPLLLMLHVAALVCWCGALLYMPAMIAAGTHKSEPLFYRDHAHLTRLVFVLLASPAALVAIASGTALFLRQGIVDPWLIVKLTAVSLLVMCHALCGVLVLRIERSPERGVALECVLVGLLCVGLVVLILWLVLAKPSLTLPWPAAIEDALRPTAGAAYEGVTSTPTACSYTSLPPSDAATAIISAVSSDR